MPSLEDLGTRQIVSGTPASDDIVAFFDVSEFGNNPVKKTTVASLLAGAAGSTDSLTTSNGTAAAAAGDLGELLSADAFSNALVDGVAEELVSLTVSPGEWDLQATVSWSSTSANTSSRLMQIADAEMSAVDTTERSWVGVSASLVERDVSKLCRVRVSEESTFSVRASASFSSGSVSVIQSRLEARRVR